MDTEKRTKQVAVYVTPTEHRELRIKAAQADQSMSDLIYGCLKGCVLASKEAPDGQ